MSSMKVMRTVGPKQMEYVDSLIPTPGPSDAIVKVEAVGLCGSDYHLYLGDHPYSQFPLIQGHEFSGIVELLPDSYEGPIRLNERVSVEPLIPCGHCYPCRNHRPNCCVNMITLGVHRAGALAQRVSVPVNLLYSTNDLQPDLAAMVEPMSIGVHAVMRGQVKAGDKVLVFGAGPIGQAITLAATDRGAKVLAVDKIESRLHLIRKIGAEKSLSSHEDITLAVAEWTQGDGASIVFDATGVPEVIRSAIDLVASSGTVVIVGLNKRDVSIPVIEFTRKELTVVGSRNNAGVFGDAVELVRRNQDKVRALITHYFSIEETASAIDFAINNPEAVEKVIIRITE